MDTVKSIVTHLAKPPFQRAYDVVSFDSLSKDDLLQILSDVLREIKPDDAFTVSMEDPESVYKLFYTLQILKYNFPSTLEHFQQSMLRVDKTTIYGILEWLLRNIEDLKKRAYLARYLIRVEIPTEILGDSDIASLNQQYLRMIEDFKKTHRESVLSKTTGKMSVAELKSDCATMEKEKEIVLNRIEQVKNKVQNLPNLTNLLRTCHNLRVEHERKKDLAWKLQDESITIQQSQHRLVRLSQQLQELKTRSTGLTVQSLLTKLEEEMYVTSYIATQKLPRELVDLKRKKELLIQLVNSANITKASNSMLESKLHALSQQVNKLTENHLAADSYDDKTVLFRQQAAVVARKKETLTEKCAELGTKLQQLQTEVAEKRQKLEESMGNVELMSGEKFQEYVNKLRARSLIYKRYRGELAALKAETGVLSRTLDVLTSKANEIGADMTQAEDKIDAEDEHRSSDTLLNLITQISFDITSEKLKLTPLINNIRPLKDECQQLTGEYEEQKRNYDRVAATLHSNIAKLENDVAALRDTHSRTVSETNLLREQTHISTVDLTNAKDEFQATIDKNNAQQSFKDRLQKQIAESDKVNKLLHEEQKRVREKEQNCARQKASWNNLCLLMECKLKCLDDEREEMESFVRLEKGAETMVLQ